jgi:tRNA (guanine-N(7)-)-methyltransferase subunit TRM82
LCGDKFGDVYSLPLIPSENLEDPRRSSIQPKPFQPAASTLTVHTKRNLQSLKQQLEQSAKPTEEKLAPAFEHKLLLGHVSILTDLAFVSLASDSSPNSVKGYILSADRDEHIRVSRGPPQAHIIETYCLGHTSFISRICVPSLQPRLLISGGGDNYLLVWDWREGRVLQTVSLPPRGSNGEELVVRGIWATSLPHGSSSFEPGECLILVALEG